MTNFVLSAFTGMVYTAYPEADQAGLMTRQSVPMMPGPIPALTV